MEHDNEIQKINQLLIAARNGKIGVSEEQILTIQKNYLNAKRPHSSVLLIIPIFGFVLGIILAAFGYLIHPGPDSTSYHFREYNQKWASGTNTRFDDMRADAESKLLKRYHDEARGPEMIFVFGILFCVCVPLGFFGALMQVRRFRVMSKNEMRQVDDLLVKLKRNNESRSA
jgi:hypothetical protein